MEFTHSQTCFLVESMDSLKLTQACTKQKCKLNTKSTSKLWLMRIKLFCTQFSKNNRVLVAPPSIHHLHFKENTKHNETLTLVSQHATQSRISAVCLWNKSHNQSIFCILWPNRSWSWVMTEEGENCCLQIQVITLEPQMQDQIISSNLFDSVFLVSNITKFCTCSISTQLPCVFCFLFIYYLCSSSMV